MDATATELMVQAAQTVVMARQQLPNLPGFPDSGSVVHFGRTQGALEIVEDNKEEDDINTGLIRDFFQTAVGSVAVVVHGFNAISGAMLQALARAQAHTPMAPVIFLLPQVSTRVGSRYVIHPWLAVPYHLCWQ